MLSVILLALVLLLHVPDELDLDKALENTVTPDSTSQSIDVPQVKTSPPKYSLSIESVSAPAGRYIDTLDIIFETDGGDGRGLAGFDLKIAVENSYLEILKILRGEIPDSCDWQYFTTREHRKSELTGLPPVIWQIIGLSQTIPDDSDPKCYGFDRPATIARLVVGNAHIREMPDTTVPIFFIWEDCTDNVVSDASGVALIMSDSILDQLPINWTGNNGEFPTRKGTPNSCINQKLENAPLRLLELNNGGVSFIYQFDNPEKNRKKSN